MDKHPCPKCHQSTIVAITYAYHEVIIDEQFGPMFDQFDLTEEYALQCMNCGWQHGNPMTPSSDMPLTKALAPELIELEEFERQLREEAKARGSRSLCPGRECPEHDGTCA